ncbi:MAG: hypothetical protein RBQ63_00005 [Acholeplasmatales bacterium]|nr:hypothetical protein [Acholeplasmatales bacterium]
MNDLNKKINELRELGYGYKKIANELNTSVSVVRYACNKQNEDGPVGYCEHCGKEMQFIKGKKRKRFCSDRCRWEWWNEYRRKKADHDE